MTDKADPADSTEQPADNTVTSDEPIAAPKDPKEEMRQALERKQAAHHQSGDPNSETGRKAGGPHGRPASKRVFRRKSG